jgi:hypothetical protein
MPGTAIHIEKQDTQADSLAIKPTGKPTITLGTSAATKILVHVL